MALIRSRRLKVCLLLSLLVLISVAVGFVLGALWKS